ncbi:hypothetical protein [Methylobacterium sp. WL8]|uniref:hypothetical protein n=1 Tax=Methylobacterium sp. WL8 TaxID=2603899 RepID=UPI001AEF345C|nr:hypothetical protein [Methylobacterium sp. WL8]
MTAPADHFGPWRQDIDPAEHLAWLHSDADARCSGLSGLLYSGTTTQSGCNGGRGCIDSCSSVIPVVTAVISVSFGARLVIIWKSAVYPLIEHHHGRAKIGRKITALGNIYALHLSPLCGTILRF